MRRVRRASNRPRHDWTRSKGRPCADWRRSRTVTPAQETPVSVERRRRSPRPPCLRQRPGGAYSTDGLALFHPQRQSCETPPGLAREVTYGRRTIPAGALGSRPRRARLAGLISAQPPADAAQGIRTCNERVRDGRCRPRVSRGAVRDAPCPGAKPPPKAYLRGGFAYWRRANVAFRLDGRRGHSRQCQCTPDPPGVLRGRATGRPELRSFATVSDPTLVRHLAGVERW